MNDTSFELGRLRVEGVAEPLGIDVRRPRFSWQITSDARGLAQTSYRVVISRIGYDGRRAPAWDSGVVHESTPFATPGSGVDLAPAAQYQWSVTVATPLGEATETSVFTTGLFVDSDWLGARWIGGPRRAEGTVPAPLLRRSFDVRADAAIHSATLFVAAGGYASVRLNGARVSDSVLAPGFTDYDHCVEYVAFDVRAALREGSNALGVELGRGFYGMRNSNVWNWHAAPWNAEPVTRIVLVVTYSDGRVVPLISDATWRWVPGPTLRDDLYGGEDYDARRAVTDFDHPEFSDEDWSSVYLREGPKGALVHQRYQPSRVTEELHPRRIIATESGGWIVEFPRVVAGWVRLRVAGARGQTITVSYGERLTADGTVDLTNNGRFGAGFQTDRFTLAGTGSAETWAPSFSYKGFQYVQLDGWPSESAPDPESIIAQVVHTDVETTGSFSSSSALMNRIHTITHDTMLNNLQGVPTDTPMFEKNGWTGDGMLGAEMFLMNFDCAALFSKWLDDIAATRIDGGAPQVIAPVSGSWGDWGPAPTWHSAYVLIPIWLATYAGDDRVLFKHYDGMDEYVRFELARSPGGIASSSLGDWVSPETDPRGENPPDDRRVPATAFLYAMLTAMSRVAQELGRLEDVGFYEAEAARVRHAFIEYFYSASEGIIRGDGDAGFRQTHNVLALTFGLVPSDAEQTVADAVAADVRARGTTLNTGALGTKYLLPVLTRYGHGDIAVAVAEQTRFPSWGFWLENGATSLWEHWKIESRSRGHYFLGTIDDWFFHDVAGIRPQGRGFETFRVHPKVTEYVDAAQASLRTPYGIAAVEWWNHDDGAFSMRVDVPVGARAQVRLPARPSAMVSERGRAIDDVEGVDSVGRDGSTCSIDLGSGSYSFEVSPD